MKKSFIFILTVLIVALCASCELDKVGGAMQSMNKNIFFPAVASEEEVKKASNDVLEIFTGKSTGEETQDPVDVTEVVNVKSVASNVIEKVLEIGKDNPLVQAEVVKTLKKTSAFGGPNIKINNSKDTSTSWIGKEVDFKKGLLNYKGSFVYNREADPDNSGKTLEVITTFFKDLTGQKLFEGKESYDLGDVIALIGSGEVSEDDITSDSETSSFPVVIGRKLYDFTEDAGSAVAITNKMVSVLNTIVDEIIGEYSKPGEDYVPAPMTTETGSSVSVNDVVVSGLLLNMIEDVTVQMTLNDYSGWFGVFSSMTSSIDKIKILMPEISDDIADIYDAAITIAEKIM